ncbi:hypothetical protein M406DRAFT_356578 [Cryphonectria parasitica EP155]|uniref:Uncharacterized protein n=1 Tax=Cryphonectria parasitica (strain ATCC 38755 / EP155) TaxID=660469 RepID=A0A9P4Y0P2_CRYP1|nr:uncharacterized protein M406DRAFT_356578 [Cryphonectria parasitica EP155]KAF3764518.1 hypothetical protein M406DRAFT_356578 [Cryphonectria parasitica EP155]
MPPRPAGAPAQPGQAQRPTPQTQYGQQMANRTTMQQQQQQQQPPTAFQGQHNPATQQNGFQQSQVDGAGEDEFEGVLLRRGENGETSEMGRVDIDRMLHRQMAARAKQLEGGGLMLPLKQATKHKSIAFKSAPAGASGFDGIDEDIKKEDDGFEQEEQVPEPIDIEEPEEDEDAINSDLDDPNEVDIEEEDDDENMDQVMLCMYDKVQRVKNKWKCTLKDGVLNVNGKDYVFHKATGEYEW